MKLTLGAIIMLGLVLGSARQSAAQDATQTLYKMKCQICHGPDATGSVAGKKLAVKDFQSPEVQKQPDAELLEVAKKGKKQDAGLWRQAPGQSTERPDQVHA
jgi:mono/diheme cytochrome c family protein